MHKHEGNAFFPSANRAAYLPQAAIDARRRYRCTYIPRTALGDLNSSTISETPYVQFRAENAELAANIAHRVTGCPVSDVERIEG